MCTYQKQARTDDYDMGTSEMETILEADGDLGTSEVEAKVDSDDNLGTIQKEVITDNDDSMSTGDKERLKLQSTAPSISNHDTERKSSGNEMEFVTITKGDGRKKKTRDRKMNIEEEDVIKNRRMLTDHSINISQNLLWHQFPLFDGGYYTWPCLAVLNTTWKVCSDSAHWPVPLD
ncbi:uncharacterized protein LOC116614411 [Nematostella vectensis]|uniref:uncharacterized protein LOC116614411 n=1 Tax=Nematostella vectensis TaxID=45351 RepID=UPI0020779610|nr:uncharacterized protein LOC116614411 [Nematostella vectensis]